MTTVIYLQGAHGRMGRTISALIQNDPQFSLSPDLANCDVALDFSAPEALADLVNGCLAFKKPVVIGTTGYRETEQKILEKASQQIPLFYAPNFSLGITLLQEILRELVEKIGSKTSIEIIEAHNQHKKDLPSGTALLLAQAAGRFSPPIHSIRAGDIIGDHTILLALEGERLELKHQAHSRDAFAQGALKAAQFLKNQIPGYYTMKDLLYASC